MTCMSLVILTDAGQWQWESRGGYLPTWVPRVLGLAPGLGQVAESGNPGLYVISIP